MAKDKNIGLTNEERLAADPELQRVADAARPVIDSFSIVDYRKVAGTAHTAFLKASVGGTNKATIAIVLDCIDRLRQHPRFQGNRKAYFLAKTNSVMGSISDYRRRLLNPPTGEPQFFSVRDLEDWQRKTYGDISNADLFDLWEAAGGKVYSDTWPLFTALQNKFRLAVTHCGFERTADSTAWALTGTTALELAIEVWQTAISSIHRTVTRLTRQAVEDTYRSFSLTPVLMKWTRAVNNLIPDDENSTFSPMDTRNINLTIEQIREHWRALDANLDAAIDAAEKYNELFRTQGERKKAIRQLAEIRQAVANERKK